MRDSFKAPSSVVVGAERIRRLIVSVFIITLTVVFPIVFPRRMRKKCRIGIGMK